MDFCKRTHEGIRDAADLNDFGLQRPARGREQL
jgi:hypothetical protein